eukprot:gene21211-28120_t
MADCDGKVTILGLAETVVPISCNATECLDSNGDTLLKTGGFLDDDDESAKNAIISAIPIMLLLLLLCCIAASALSRFLNDDDESAKNAIISAIPIMILLLLLLCCIAASALNWSYIKPSQALQIRARGAGGMLELAGAQVKPRKESVLPASSSDISGMAIPSCTTLLGKGGLDGASHVQSGAARPSSISPTGIGGLDAVDAGEDVATEVESAGVDGGSSVATMVLRAAKDGQARAGPVAESTTPGATAATHKAGDGTDDITMAGSPNAMSHIPCLSCLKFQLSSATPKAGDAIDDTTMASLSSFSIPQQKEPWSPDDSIQCFQFSDISVVCHESPILHSLRGIGKGWGGGRSATGTASSPTTPATPVLPHAGPGPVAEGGRSARGGAEGAAALAAGGAGDVESGRRIVKRGGLKEPRIGSNGSGLLQCPSCSGSASCRASWAGRGVQEGGLKGASSIGSQGGSVNGVEQGNLGLQLTNADYPAGPFGGVQGGVQEGGLKEPQHWQQGGEWWSAGRSARGGAEGAAALAAGGGVVNCVARVDREECKRIPRCAAALAGGVREECKRGAEWSAALAQVECGGVQEGGLKEPQHWQQGGSVNSCSRQGNLECKLNHADSPRCAPCRWSAGISISGGILYDPLEDCEMGASTKSSHRNGKRILHPMSSSANVGGLVGILGPSGSGKSTLINVLSGTISGSVNADGYTGAPAHGQLSAHVH